MFLGQSRENLQIPVRAVKSLTQGCATSNRISGTLPRSQSVRGIVIDPRGQPLGNASVIWRLTTDDLIRPNGTHEMLTSGDGSFAFDNLPDKPIELEVSAQFLQVPNGWTQRSVYPARVDPEMNQQDVVIFYDSSLNYQIETIKTRHIDEAIDKSK